MSEELGKIEKPAASDFAKKRKLYYVPLVHISREAPAEYQQLYDKYWSEVEKQLSGLEAKLGKVRHIFHELATESGESGTSIIKDINDRAFLLIEARRDDTTQMEATEDVEILSEFIDWSRCLALGLQNKNVFTAVYKSYTESVKKRNDYIVKRITDTIKEDEAGVLLFTEGYSFQFPGDIEVFYLAPPALDEIKRMVRDEEARAMAEAKAAAESEKRVTDISPP